jgi:hypothetical protein
MHPSEYPARKCREAVFNEHGMAYICELADLHRGPCASLSVKASMLRRDTWEDANPDDINATHPSDDIIL